ncbi:hypothetical protein DH2020_049141 [Rehmannia glutinosa]|uniref:DUF4005 domain-containing protein n=1 Tax=Rehmannia glutinosa TaxID=99300 RepID=A0ABR0U3N9_REHGL
MGKASKWFRGLFGLKKPEPKPNPNPAPKPPAKKKWSFAKSHKEKDHQKSQHTVARPGGYSNDDASQHAIAVAAATAAVAEAAVAAAQAAAAVVKLTSSGGNTSKAGSGAGCFYPVAYVSRSGAGYGNREEWAAVTIQSHFRAYLDGLWVLSKTVPSYLPLFDIGFGMEGPATPEKFESKTMKHQQMMLKRNGSKSNGNVTYDPENPHSMIRNRMIQRMSERSWEHGSFTRIIPSDDEISDKILEIDTGKPHVTPKPDNSPQFYSASSNGGSSKTGPFTPTKSDGSRSCLSGYSDHPNYMAYTESSKAKVRSISAPKQRPVQYERSSSMNRCSVHGYDHDLRANAQKVSALHANFANKAYPGSGRLDRLGMPVMRGDVSGFSGGHWHRY